MALWTEARAIKISQNPRMKQHLTCILLNVKCSQHSGFESANHESLSYVKQYLGRNGIKSFFPRSVILSFEWVKEFHWKAVSFRNRTRKIGEKRSRQKTKKNIERKTLMHVEKFVINYKQMFHFWELLMMQFNCCCSFEIHPFTYHIPGRIFQFNTRWHTQRVYEQHFYWCVVTVVSQRQRTYKSSFEHRKMRTKTQKNNNNKFQTHREKTQTHNLFSSEMPFGDRLYGVCSFNL